MDAPALARFVGAPASDPYVAECAALVAAHVGDRASAVPARVMARAVLEVGADLYHRRSARNGIAAFEESDIAPAPVRINRDPLVPARPILAPWMGVPIA